MGKDVVGASCGLFTVCEEVHIVSAIGLTLFISTLFLILPVCRLSV